MRTFKFLYPITESSSSPLVSFPENLRQGQELIISAAYVQSTKQITKKEMLSSRRYHFRDTKHGKTLPPPSHLLLGIYTPKGVYK